MFEVECPSCRAGYKVDERRVPPGGLKMRCPKCGESFQVSTGSGPSEPPVLGAVLGLSKGSETPPQAPQAAARSQRRNPKATMIGVAPAQGPAGRDDGLELASLDEEESGTSPHSDEAEWEAALPATRAPETDPDEVEWEAALPATRAPEADLDEDLEADLPAPSSWGELDAETDLPAPGSRASVPHEIDLPMEESVEEGDDLPDLARADGQEVDLPSLSGELPDLEADLPSPADGGADASARGQRVDLPDLADPGLPTVGEPGLPATAGPGLPARSEGELPDLAAGLPEPTGSLPSRAEQDAGELPSYRPGVPGLVTGGLGNTEELDFEEDFEDESEAEFEVPPGPAPGRDADLFGAGPTTTPESVKPHTSDPAAFGEVDFGGDEQDHAEEFDAFPTESPPHDSSGPTTVGPGGAGYGDVDLGGDDDSVGLGADIDRPPAPGGAPAAATAQVERHGARPSVPVPKQKVPRSGLSRGAKAVIGVAVVLTVAGGALAVLPEVGPYGAYVVLDALKADEYQSALSSDRERVRERLGRDTAADYDAAFALMERGIADAPRFGPRKAYTAYVGLLRELRFGADSNAGARARVLLGGLTEASPEEVDFLALARDARAAADGKPSEVTSGSERKIQNSPEHAMVVGEAALRERKGELAQEAFAALPGDTAQATFGKARALLLDNQVEQALELAQQTLEKNGEHPGASLLLAGIVLRDVEKDAELSTLLQPLSEGKGGVSRGEQVNALVLLGDLHMARSRINRAEEAYQKALQLESGNAAAQRGLADALFAGGRFSEAQTRYEAALKADPDSLLAALGLVRSKLRLEELEQAVTLLQNLEKEYSGSTSVHYWMGRAHEQAGKKDLATQAYEKAIELDQPGEALVKSFVALTRLLGQSGDMAEADEVIRQAREKFPKDPLVFAALAELAESRGSYEEAVQNYDRALGLDPNNVGLRFSKGIALRKARRFEEAAAEFDAVEKESKDYPALALERGNLYEASGKTEQALEAYEEALAAAPEDVDLMLRVGCGKAAAGQPGPALELLTKVLEARPNSAEVNFCVGLAHLEDEKHPEARRFIQRAVNFDSSRANYHLYLGWVALEMNDYAVAHQSLEKALEIDQTLADAYWKQGELLVKQGAIASAENLLRKALELAPSRHEAHAQLALALSQMGKEQEALSQWKLATGHEAAEAHWHYLHGKLLFDNRQLDRARDQLQMAIEKVQDEEPAPSWRWEAHRVLAMAIGRKKETIDHWKAFLNNGPKASAYRREAERELAAILSMLGF